MRTDTDKALTILKHFFNQKFLGRAALIGRTFREGKLIFDEIERVLSAVDVPFKCRRNSEKFECFVVTDSLRSF